MYVYRILTYMYTCVCACVYTYLPIEINRVMFLQKVSGPLCATCSPARRHVLSVTSPVFYMCVGRLADRSSADQTLWGCAAPCPL